MNLNTSQLLENAVRAGASDVFIVAGLPVSMRINGVIAREDECRLLPEDTRMVIGQIYQLAGNRPISNLEDSGDDDFSFAIPGLSRFRVSAYKQRGALSVVIRIITFTLPDPKEIGLPDSPDVILLGEMRDYETMQVAMTAAETGHLIFSTLHTIGAANTIDRIIDVFPPNQQRQIAVQLSMVLQAVVSQQLVPSIDGRMVPAFEIMTVTPAIRNMIRDNKIPQIDGILYSSANEDMVSMDLSLLKLFKENIISADTALAFATNPDMLRKKF